VVKSQIHAGGRGKGKFKELGPDAKGGVRLAKSIEEAKAHAKDMLGNTLVTKQTGPAGKQVNRLYIEDGADIDRELYLSLLVDRSVGRLPSSFRPKAAWTSRPLRMTRRKRSSRRDRSGQAGVTADDRRQARRR
jgi:succinyl-CoA synthetase beta subunit